MTEPVKFLRGSTFNFLMRLPEEISAGEMKVFQPTAQLRKYKNSSKSGLIADINCFWADPKTNLMLALHHSMTEDWPLGLAEMDVLFTNTSGFKLRSTTVQIEIVRGITK